MSVLVFDNPITKVPFRKMFKPYRILIMKYLEQEQDGISFQQLKNAFNLTDGNLASYLKPLEEDEYITFRKHLKGHKTITIYTLTPKGKEILNSFTKELLRILT